MVADCGSLISGIEGLTRVGVGVDSKYNPLPGPLSGSKEIMTTATNSLMPPPASRISEREIEAQLSSRSTDLPIPVDKDSWKVNYGFDFDGDPSVYVSVTVEDDDIEDGDDKYHKRGKSYLAIHKIVSEIVDPEIFVHVDVYSPSDLKELEELESSS